MTKLVGQESVWKECINQFNTTSHVFITGPAGCGKTTIMRELLKEYSISKKRANYQLWGVESIDECLLLGPDQDRGIQTIRGQVSLFIRQMSIGDQIYRWIVIDDVDTFPHISQQALRRPMESYSHITRFLFIGTSQDDLIPALRSRCIHIEMNRIDPMLYKNSFLKYADIHDITEEMWLWIMNISGNNISDLVRFLKLIKDVHITFNEKITLESVKLMCSTPFYMDFIPLLMAMSCRDNVMAINSLLLIWKRGYTYEDILESFQIINNLFGNNLLKDNIVIHKFLINAWISYCKGNTSILALQNIIYKTLAY